jgi:hypothetical protein
MSDFKHQWTTFIKRRLKLCACSNCGELYLPSNKDNRCDSSNLSDSLIVRSGYIKESIPTLTQRA